MALSRFERADDSHGFLLLQLTNLWQQRIRAALTPLGITHVQFVLLASTAWLENTETVVSQAVLSRHAHTDIMMTSQVVRALEDKGLLTRSMHPTDTRARALSLTAEGRAVAQQAMSIVEAVDEQFFQALGGQTSTFVGLMQLLIRTYTEAQISDLET